MIHDNVPEDLRHLILRSSVNYTVNDLKRLSALNIPSNEIDSNSAVNNSIFLLTQWYHEIDSRRRYELVAVLHMNVINPAITQIHFIQNTNHCTIYDDIQIDRQFPVDLLRKKLVIFYDRNSLVQSERLVIHQAFQYANRYLSRGYIVLLNLDIFFDQSLLILRSRSLLNSKTILYLSRYEIDPSITTLGSQCSDESYVGSHDSFIFQTPIDEHLARKFPFEIGTWHVEVKLIYEFLEADYIVRNPCKTIRIWHFHSSQIRHRLMPSEKYIPDRFLSKILRYPEYL